MSNPQSAIRNPQWYQFRENEERHVVASRGAAHLHTGCGLTFHAACARESAARQCRNCRRSRRAARPAVKKLTAKGTKGTEQIGGA